LRAELRDEGLEPLQRSGAHPQKTRAPRAAQELAAGAGEQVAADRLHIHRELAGRLGGIEQEQRTTFAREPPDLGHRLHQPAAGGHVTHPDQPGPLASQPGEGGHVQLPVGIVRDHDHICAGALGGLQVGQHVAAVLGAPGQDPVTRTERHRVERGIPSARGVVEQRHLLTSAADQLGDGAIGGSNRIPRRGGGFVAPDLRLQAQVAGHRIQRRLCHQRGTSVVQMVAVRAPGGLGAQSVNVHAPILSRSNLKTTQLQGAAP